MLISADEFIRVAKKVRAIVMQMEAMCLQKYHLPLSINELHRIIEDMYDITVERKAIIRPPSLTSSLSGSLARFKPKGAEKKGRAVILVDNNLPLFDKRYVAAKELCHIAIDEEDDWSADPEKTIDDLLTTFKIEYERNGDHSVENRVIISEILAEVAATEILYPSTNRQLDKANLLAKTTSLPALEAQYQIPRIIILRALNEQYANITNLMMPYMTGEKL